MNTLIVGAGGVGGYYGGLLAKAGNDVTFLARGEHAKAMRESGLHVKCSVGNFLVKPVHVISSLREAQTPELVFVCVKAYHIEDIAQELASVVGARTLIIPLQNGIDNDKMIGRHVSNAIVVPGTTWVISKRTAPGMIEQTGVVPGTTWVVSKRAAPGTIEQTGGQGTVIFGDRNGLHQDLLNQIEKLMCSADIDAKNVDNIERELWLKYLWILGFAGMTSLCRNSLGPIASDHNTLAIYARCLAEAFSVAKHLKVDVNNNDSEKFMRRIEMLRQSNPGAKSSMLVDIENHRQTEIESLHGKLCQMARQCSIDVPVNEIIYATVRLTHPQAVLVN